MARVVTGSRWAAIVGYSLVGAATQLVWLNFAGVTTDAAAHYGVSESAIGWLAQVFPLLYVVLAIPCGLALDRWFRPGLVVGAWLTCAGAAVRLIGDDYGWLLAGQIVAAIAQPLVLNAVTGITGHYLAPDDRPKGIAVGTASIFAGMILAFLLTATFGPSLHPMLVVSAAFCLAAAAILTTALRTPGTFAPAASSTPAAAATPAAASTPASASVRADASAPADASAAASAPASASTPAAASGSAAASAPGPDGQRPGERVPGERSPLRIAWADPLIRRLSVLAIFPFGVFVALSTFTQALLEPAGVTSTAASAILLTNVIAGVLGSAIIPVIIARHRAESTHLALSLTFTALACVALAIAPGVLTGFIAITLIGLLLLPALPIVLELVERRTGEAEGTAAGLIWMAGNLGGLLVAVTVGLLVDHPTAAFLVMALIALIAVPGARSLKRPIAELQPPSQP
ncbi:MFS transporter [Kribbella sp. NPDC050124]|uniref:MFS transporter n=1 Tax=Kribbella sp. NPDC050124 TaxID=3364114 RepID=UPI0037AB18FD